MRTRPARPELVGVALPVRLAQLAGPLALAPLRMVHCNCLSLCRLGADGLPLSSPTSPCAAVGASGSAVAPCFAEHSGNAGGADHVAANRTSGLGPSPTVPYGPVGIVPARAGYGLLACYRC